MLESIEVRGFRNLTPQTWAPGPGHHLILGTNGAGKTSLLEAVYLVATTRSFRTGQLADCCHRNADAFRIEAVAQGDRRYEIALGWHRGPAGGSRSRLLDGNHVPLAEHIAALRVLAWTATDAELLTGPPALRRQLLDRGMVSLRPAAIAVLARYRQALAAKRKLLVQGIAPRSAELSAWNASLVREAAPLHAARSAYSAALSQALADVQSSVDLDLPALELAYRPSLEPVEEDPESALRAVEDAASREIAAKRVLLGPHLDDLKVGWQGATVRKMASAGERKALGLLLLAAQARVIANTGRPPTLLVDDADTELDAGRLARVWPALRVAEQLFATSNRPEVWSHIEASSTWSVEDASIRRRSHLFSTTK